MSSNVSLMKKKLGAIGVLSQFFMGLCIAYLILGGAFMAVGTAIGLYGLNNNPEMFTFEHVMTGLRVSFTGLIWGVISLAIREIRGSLLRIEGSVAKTAVQD